MEVRQLYSFLVLLLISLVGAQGNKNGLNICRRYGHQTTILDGKLYIDGGWVYSDITAVQSNKPVPNRNLIYSDLGQVTGNMPSQFSLQKDTTVPSVAGGILWSDEVNKVFWQFGGEFANSGTAVDFELWGYDTFLNKWNLSTPQTNSAVVSRVSYGAGTALDGIGYYYGGYLSNLTVPGWSGPPVATSNLIKYDMNTATFYNETGPDTLGRAEGVMVSIPISIKGMLVYFGGIQYYSSSSPAPMPLSQILLYDINEKRWFNQPAVGDIPADRHRFCAGAAWAKDQSSFNIYIYGGFGFGVNASGFDDVYILSLPTFTWIKWYPTEYPYDPASHGDLTCNVVKSSQMIIMGGNFTNTSTCDSAADAGAQHNLNLGQNNFKQSKWYDYLTNLTSYIVPPAIVAVTGGNANGGATNLKPASGQFIDARLDTYFSQKASPVTRTPTRYLPSPTNSSSPSSNPNIGAIAGGVVAGVVVLVVAAVLLWWFCFRKKPRTPPEPTRINELVGDSRPDVKPTGIASPSSVHSGVVTPYSTPPPAQSYPPYGYVYPVPQQYFPVPMQQAMYYPQPMYPMPGPPPDGHYQQQGFYAQAPMQEHVAHEMPITRIPGEHSSPTSGHGSTAHESVSDHDTKYLGSPTYRSR